MRVRSHAITHAGRVLKTNEDAYLQDDESGFYLVSDGVGSTKQAAAASRLAVEVAARELRLWPSPSPQDRLGRAIREANREVNEQAARVSRGGIMATTLTALLLSKDEFHVAHVGDSRAYLLRDGRLQQITRDHSVAFEQYLVGAISKDDLRHHPNQKLLTRTMGANDFVIPDLIDGALQPGDRFLLCSDGISKELADERVRDLLSAAADPASACRALLEAANAAGGRDNITVVVVDVA
jgi:protein phosphatase